MEDVYVGWQFGQIFYKKNRWKWFPRLLRSSKMKAEEDGLDSNDNLVLGKRLIYDIIPQQGGGQEPIKG